MTTNPVFNVRSSLAETAAPEGAPPRWADRSERSIQRNPVVMDASDFFSPGGMPKACAQLDESLWQLYYQIEALRSDDSPYALQIVPTSPGSGSTTVAQGFALAAAAESCRPVLMLSCDDSQDGADPCSSDGGAGSLEQVPGVPHLYVGRVGGAHHGRSSATEVRLMLETFRERFPIIVLDCSAIDSSPLALGLCKHCDGTLLVVQAERDSRRVARACLSRIERFGGIAVGVVLNKTRSHVPAWLNRFLG